MKTIKFFSFFTKSSLLVGAVSLGTISLSSCFVEVWSTNIQLVISPAGSKLADHSFTQGTWEGIHDFFKDYVYENQKWVEPNPDRVTEKIGGIWRHPTGLDSLKFIESYRDAHASGANLLVCPGFEHTGPLEEFSSTDKKIMSHYPSWAKALRKKIGIIYVDGFLDKQKKINPYNIASIDYKVDEAGFLGGVMMGIFLNLDKFYTPVEVNFSAKKYSDLQADLAPDTTSWYNGKTFLVGSYVGLPIPPTLTYFNGLCQGMNFFNNNAQGIKNLLSQSQPKPIADKTKEWYPVTLLSPDDTYAGLTMQNFSSGSFSPVEQRARTLTDILIDKKAAAILPVAGTQIALAVNEVAEKKSHTAILGNDSPQENDPSVNQYQNDSDKHSIIPYSITLNLTGSTTETLKAIDQAIRTGNYQVKSERGYRGFGYNNWAGYSQGGVGLSDGKIFYDSDNGKKNVSTNTILQRIETIMKGKEKQGEGAYSKVIGNELNSNWVACFETQDGKKFSVLSAPKIASSSDDASKPNNTYTKPSQQDIETPIADVNDIQNFLKTLRDEIGMTNGKLNWYMRPNW